MGKVIDFRNKDMQFVEEVTAAGNFALSLATREAREVYYKKLNEEYSSFNDITRDIIESFMVPSAKAANDIYYLMTRDTVEIEDANFVTGLVVEEEREMYLKVEAVNELTILKNNKDPLEEIVALVCEVSELLAEAREKAIKQMKEDLLSEEGIEELSETFESMGLVFDKKDIKATVEDSIEQFGVIGLLKLGYIG